MNSYQKQKNFIKPLFYGLLILLSAYSCYSIYAASQKMYWDFPNYYVSSKLVAEGEPVSQFYDNKWFNEKGQAMGIERTVQFNPFPPITAVVMLPLTIFDPITAKRVWIAINILLLFATIRLLNHLFGFEYSLGAFLVLSAGLSLGLNFRLGQFYLLMLWLLLVIYSLHREKKNLISSFLLGLISWIKYMPVVFILGFLKRKYVQYFALTMSVLLVFQWIIFGTETIETYVTVLFNHLNGSIDGQGEHRVAFQSFDSLLANIFVQHPTFNPVPLIDWSPGKTVFKVLIMVLILGISFRFYQTLGSKDSTQKTDHILIITGMTTMALLPASASYHYLLLLFPLTILLSYSLGNVKFSKNIFLLLLFWLVANASIISIPNLNVRILDLVLDYPRLWLMMGLYFYSFHILRQIDHSKTRLTSLSYQNLVESPK